MDSAMLYVTLWLISGFLAGSIPFGWIVARLAGMDIRAHGSGNIGMTNVWRVLGWKHGVTVLLLDMLKGLLPVQACEMWFPRVQIDKVIPAKLSGNLLTESSWIAYSNEAHYLPWVLMGVGLAAILGHTFTPWLRFKGGKGVATGLGVVIALFKLWVLIPVAVFVLAVAVTRYVSLGSILGAVALATLCFVVPQLTPLRPFGALAPLVILFTHRANIQRLLAGTENRVGGKRPEDASGPVGT